MTARAPGTALVFATLVVAMPPAASSQTLSVLHIRVVLADAERKVTPVARHALLIGDNPPTATPRLIVTRLDGTADVQLRPGNYTVESDRPVVFYGRAYQWTQMVEVVAGRNAVLELTSDNAEVEPAASATSTSEAPLESDPSFLLSHWQDSVVALWTPTTRASAFVIDARGLLATNQRVVGSATSVEVQLTPAVKVAASVLAADPVRDVAVLQVDAKSIASVRPVPMPCRQPEKTPRELPPVRQGHVDRLNALDDEHSSPVSLLAIRDETLENLIRAVPLADQKSA